MAQVAPPYQHTCPCQSPNPSTSRRESPLALTRSHSEPTSAASRRVVSPIPITYRGHAREQLTFRQRRDAVAPIHATGEMTCACPEGSARHNAADLPEHGAQEGVVPEQGNAGSGRSAGDAPLCGSLPVTSEDALRAIREERDDGADDDEDRIDVASVTDDEGTPPSSWHASSCAGHDFYAHEGPIAVLPASLADPHIRPALSRLDTAELTKSNLARDRPQTVHGPLQRGHTKNISVESTSPMTPPTRGVVMPRVVFAPDVRIGGRNKSQQQSDLPSRPVVRGVVRGRIFSDLVHSKRSNQARPATAPEDGYTSPACDDKENVAYELRDDTPHGNAGTREKRRSRSPRSWRPFGSKSRPTSPQSEKRSGTREHRRASAPAEKQSTAQPIVLRHHPVNIVDQVTPPPSPVSLSDLRSSHTPRRSHTIHASNHIVGFPDGFLSLPLHPAGPRGPDAKGPADLKPAAPEDLPPPQGLFIPGTLILDRTRAFSPGSVRASASPSLRRDSAELEGDLIGTMEDGDEARVVARSVPTARHTEMLPSHSCPVSQDDTSASAHESQAPHRHLDPAVMDVSQPLREQSRALQILDSKLQRIAAEIAHSSQDVPASGPSDHFNVAVQHQDLSQTGSDGAPAMPSRRPSGRAACELSRETTLSAPTAEQKRPQDTVDAARKEHPRGVSGHVLLSNTSAPESPRYEMSEPMILWHGTTHELPDAHERGRADTAAVAFRAAMFLGKSLARAFRARTPPDERRRRKEMLAPWERETRRERYHRILDEILHGKPSDGEEAFSEDELGNDLSSKHLDEIIEHSDDPASYTDRPHSLQEGSLGADSNLTRRGRTQDAIGTALRTDAAVQGTKGEVDYPILSEAPANGSAARTQKRPRSAPSRTQPAPPFSPPLATPSVRHSSSSNARPRRSSLTTVPTRIVSSRPSLPTAREVEVMPPVAWGWGPTPHLAPVSRSNSRRSHSSAGIFSLSKKTTELERTSTAGSTATRRGVRFRHDRNQRQSAETGDSEEPIPAVLPASLTSPRVAEEDARSQVTFASADRDDFRALPERYTPSVASRPASILGPPSILRSSLPANAPLGAYASSGSHSTTPPGSGVAGLSVGDPRPTPFEVGSPCSSVSHQYGPFVVDDGLHALPSNVDRLPDGQGNGNAGGASGGLEAQS